MPTRSSYVTVDHDEIRNWVEAHGGHPTSVKGTASGGDEAGVLRIDFEKNGMDDELEPISWDDFFEKFEKESLAFVYQDKKRSGEDSTFFKFIDRDSARMDEFDQSSARQVDHAQSVSSENRSADASIACLQDLMNSHSDLIDSYEQSLAIVNDAAIREFLLEQQKQHEEHYFEFVNLIFALDGQDVLA